MDEPTQKPLFLSGRALVGRHAATLVDRQVFGMLESDQGRQPMRGDLRLEVLIGHDARTTGLRGEPAGVCRGVLTGSIFDGECWRRFELASLTANIRFGNAAQLGAVLRWVASVARSSTGCTALWRDATSTAPAAYAAIAVSSCADRYVAPPAPEDTLRRLTYRSLRSPELTDEQLLRELIVPAAQQNRREGITGCLSCGERSFVQVIEGPPTVVEGLLMRLLRDNRHSNLNILADVSARTRLFSTWGLKWVRGAVCQKVDVIADSAAVVASRRAAAAKPVTDADAGRESIPGEPRAMSVNRKPWCG